MKNFVNLHVQSHYSILQSIPTIDELVLTAEKLNQKSLALTDFNNMCGVPEFHKKTKNKDIKPIFGIKIEIMEKSRFSSQKKEDPPIAKHTLILLAKNNDGYHNLLKISSLGYDDGYFGRFCVDKTLLSKYSSDLIALTSDNTGKIRQYAHQKNNEKLEEYAFLYQEIFGKENFFIELQDTGLLDDKLVNKTLIEFAKKQNIPLVATNPVKYIKPDDHKLLEIVFCIRKKEFISEKIASEGNDYFKSSEEMYESFKEIPEALTNTLKISDMCCVEFSEVKDQSPIYKVPKNETTSEFLRKKSIKELTEKMNGNLSEEYKKRLNWELDMVCNMGFPNYFLVVSDFVEYAKKNGILVGPGRGSAAGSLLSYALNITAIDPIKYHLLFERFLNPQRISMPDIDIDFEDERRDEVKQYLRTYYGANKTADVVTFGYNKSKAVLKDVGRVLEIPLPRVNQIVGLVDPNESLDIQTNKIPELNAILSGTDIKEKEWLRYSIKLANRIRNLSTHASALIVSQNVLNTVIPLFRDKSNTIVTAFEGKYLEENGLLKMDILGLSNLSIIRDCLDRIYESYQISIDLNKISLDDKKVFDMFTAGHTAGIFQFESTGMTNYIKQLQPSCIEDLIAMNALYRPGPIDNIPSFINRKLGIEPINCFHKNLEPILKNTYGIIVYQEQVMQIAQILSGFSLGEADIIRRIMAKKKPDELETIRPKWIKGAIAQGYEKELAETLFELLIPFSNYAFNKSHAAAYSILAYQIAWLKTHYSTEFIASLMSSNMANQEDLVKYISEATKLNIAILIPDINNSLFKFTVETIKDAENKEKLAIRFGFGAIKGLGEQTIKDIIREREWGGNFISVEDFIERTSLYPDIRKASIEILLKAGTFDSLLSKEHLMIEKAAYLNPKNISMLYDKFEKKEKNDSSYSLFTSEELNATYNNIKKKEIPPLTFQEDFENEIKVFGFYLTRKLFSIIENNFGKLTTFDNSLKEIMPTNTIVSFLGYTANMHIHINQKNRHKSWAKFTLYTEENNIDFLIFNEKLVLLENNIVENAFVFLKAKIIERKNMKTYDLESIMALSENSLLSYKELNILLENELYNKEIDCFLKELKKIASENYRNNGYYRIVFYLKTDSYISRTLKAESNYCIIYPSEKLQKILENNVVKSFWFS